MNDSSKTPQIPTDEVLRLLTTVRPKNRYRILGLKQRDMEKLQAEAERNTWSME